MPTYVYDPDRDRMVDKKTGEPMVSGPWKPATPMTMGDIEGYVSPIDGSWIEGRRARRYDLEKNGCVDANELRSPKRLKNARFAKSRGLQHLLDQ